MSVTGGLEDPPTKSGLSLVDFSAGYLGAIAVLAGVWRARRDGVGGDADLSLFETALSLLTYMGTWSASQGWEARRMPSSAHQTLVPFQAFEAADGWLVVACPKETLWRGLCTALGEPALADDERFADLGARDRNRGILIPILQAAFERRTVSEWVDLMSAHKVPCAPVNDIPRARRPPGRCPPTPWPSTTIRPSGWFAPSTQPCGSTGLASHLRGAPFLGEHSAQVLADVCGYSRERIDELAALGVLGQLEPTAAEP